MSVIQPISRPIATGIREPLQGFHKDTLDYFQRLQNAGAYLPKYDIANDYLIRALANLGGAYWDSMGVFNPFVGKTFAGLTVPLRDGMDVPANVGFVSSDWVDATGLNGDGSSYLDSNRHGTDDPQDDFSMGAWAYDAANLGAGFLGSGTSQAGSAFLYQSGAATTIQTRFRSSGLDSVAGVTSGWTGYIGASRSSAAGFDVRVDGATTAKVRASDGRYATDYIIFGRGGMISPQAFLTSRLSLYHIGPAVDVAVMDTICTNFMALIANA